MFWEATSLSFVNFSYMLLCCTTEGFVTVCVIDHSHGLCALGGWSIAEYSRKRRLSEFIHVVVLYNLSL